MNLPPPARPTAGGNRTTPLKENTKMTTSRAGASGASATPRAGTSGAPKATGVRAGAFGAPAAAGVRAGTAAAAVGTAARAAGTAGTTAAHTPGAAR